jgi:hypothetical protein
VSGKFSTETYFRKNSAEKIANRFYIFKNHLSKNTTRKRRVLWCVWSAKVLYVIVIRQKNDGIFSHCVLLAWNCTAERCSVPAQPAEQRSAVQSGNRRTRTLFFFPKDDIWKYDAGNNPFRQPFFD